MVKIVISKFINQKLVEIQMVEWVWTLIPALLLFQIAIPRLILLYIIDESAIQSLTFKALGHQWYWSYEYADISISENLDVISFDSYIISTSELESGHFRLLETDNRIIVPKDIPIRVLTCSTDVLHSWTVPSLGVKADAVPGRLNTGKFLINRYGLFFGQCSEICGANHRFMPIVVESIKSELFTAWYLIAGNE